MIQIIGMAVAFMAVIMVIYYAVDALFLQKARIKKRLADISGDSAEQPEAQNLSNQTDLFPTVEKIIERNGLADKLLQELLRAGIKLRPSEFIGIIAAITLILALLAAAATSNIGVEFLAIVCGIFIPYAYVKNLQNKRIVMFNNQLPDALALIASAIRSGFSFQRALQMVAEEMPAPISEEFERVINELNVGLSTDIALKGMVSRVVSYDLELVVTAVLIQQQIGGNLAEILDNIGTTIRDRVKIEGEIQALTAEGKLSGVILTLLPFAMAGIIFIIKPGYLRPLIQEPMGIWLIIGGLTLQAIGGLVIRRMLTLDF